ncbi:MAG: nucleotidyltransferase domain-containing protein [Saprospiraceae bacterium]|uniref:Nucleotidyltransferase domain-containing protein n=1 Tax=Candidatus Opimibacter skivensis TaxID=2982028 RepID=A0A9D7SRQ8_9BACT|nr:nucleotidyltransferase domain-containing protein [Candidatus Opimibacter skivensis]
MNLDQLRENKLIVLECISGSKAYGLDTITSDTDIKGVFVLPKQNFYGLHHIPQISNATNDVVFYELKRFIELLSVNNPNILELLNTPDTAIISKHPFLNKVQSGQILSKLCKDTFGKFALSQIKKAKGLNKKIVNPVSEERKSILSFCYITHEYGSLPLEKFLHENNWNQEDCGLVNVPNMKHIYGLYYGKNLDYNGIIKSEDSNDISLSSIPKGEFQIALLYFNVDQYSLYCKEYREYWDWVANRNHDRYETTMNHGKNYDAKNMMHTFRLLDMAIEIAKEQKVNVVRPNREFLLEVKNGRFEYDDLVKMSEKKRIEMESAFENSSLPDTPDLLFLDKLAYELRDQFYSL